MFNIVLDFLKSYYREIISVASAIICLIIFLLKKKSTFNAIDDVELQIIEELPGFICMAEKSGLSGQDKLDMVLGLSLHYIKKLFNRSLTDDEASIFIKFIVDNVENILATPQKKGD